MKEMVKKQITIYELAQNSNINERTLRFYEERNLLLPIGRNEKGARIYGMQEALRLQQILLYKRMQFSLYQIKQILDHPTFDLEQSLVRQTYFLSNSKRE